MASGGYAPRLHLRKPFGESLGVQHGGRSPHTVRRSGDCRLDRSADYLAFVGARARPSWQSSWCSTSGGVRCNHPVGCNRSVAGGSGLDVPGVRGEGRVVRIPCLRLGLAPQVAASGGWDSPRRQLLPSSGCRPGRRFRRSGGSLGSALALSVVVGSGRRDRPVLPAGTPSSPARSSGWGGGGRRWVGVPRQGGHPLPFGPPVFCP